MRTEADYLGRSRDDSMIQKVSISGPLNMTQEIHNTKRTHRGLEN